MNIVVSEDEVKSMKHLALDAKEVLVSKTGAGNDFLGWIDLPVNYDQEEFARIKKAAEKIQGDSEVLLVIGIGGSYLGARAAIEFLRHSFYNVGHHPVRQRIHILLLSRGSSSARIMFETVLNIETSREEILIGEEPVDLDGLNYLAGKSVDFVNKSAMNGTIQEAFLHTKNGIA